MAVMNSMLNEYEDMLSFIDSLTENEELYEDAILKKISNLNHDIRSRVLNNTSKGLGKNENKDSSVESIEEFKKQLSEYEKDYQIAQSRMDKLRRLKFLYLSLLNDYNCTQVEKECGDNLPGEDFDSSKIRLLQIQEMERVRIANDLHDSAIQNLVGLVHKAELCSRLMDSDQARVRIELSAIIDVLKNAIASIRSSIFDLRPVSFEDFGLMGTIENFVKNINMDACVDFTFTEKGKPINLPGATEMSIYHIAQEACQNIIKHSKATKASVTLSYTKKGVTLTVSDNGQGIPSEASGHKDENFRRNFGMIIMKERAELINADFSVNSSHETGTKIVLKLNVN